jgi:hypothetical protein
MGLLGATSATVVIAGAWNQLESFRQGNRSDAGSPKRTSSVAAHRPVRPPPGRPIRSPNR